MLKMFDSLLPYFGGKRKLCSVIFGNIARHLPREEIAKLAGVGSNTYSRDK